MHILKVGKTVLNLFDNYRFPIENALMKLLFWKSTSPLLVDSIMYTPVFLRRSPLKIKNIFVLKKQTVDLLLIIGAI